MFLLRTFGALELTTEHGVRVTGAAAQRKPLLILALAALVPGGIPRERLLRALWPGADRTRARATLKQHLYALRRATGDAALVAGAPRLGINSAAIRVDAIEFVRMVADGRLHEASALMLGELFEDLAEPGAELRDIVAEIRAAYAPQMLIVRQAAANRPQRAPAMIPTPVRPVLGAERELAAASRRFARGLISLPADRVPAHHRAAGNAHDLLEALSIAEQARVDPVRIGELLDESATLWRRSELVCEMIAAPPGQSGAIEALEWLVAGGVRTAEPVGGALERYLLQSGIANLFRARGTWEMRHLARALARQSDPGPRVLAFPSPGSRELAEWLPLLQRTGASVVVCDPDDRALALAQHRLASLGHRLVTLASDPFAEVDALQRAGPFDLILTGTLFDHLQTRQAAWLVERLLGMLAGDGVLVLTSVATEAPFGPWLRHIANWPTIERDQDDILNLLGSHATTSTVTWDRDPAGHAWFVTVRSSGAFAANHRVA